MNEEIKKEEEAENNEIKDSNEPSNEPSMETSTVKSNEEKAIDAAYIEGNYQKVNDLVQDYIKSSDQNIKDIGYKYIVKISPDPWVKIVTLFTFLVFLTIVILYVWPGGRS